MDFIRIITAVLCFLLPAQIQAAPQWNQWNQNYGSGSSATNINCGQPGSCLGVGIGSAIGGIASAIGSIGSTIGNKHGGRPHHHQPHFPHHHQPQIPKHQHHGYGGMLGLFGGK